SNRALQSHEGCSTIGPVSDDLCHERVVERGHARARLDVSIDANTLACRPHHLTHYARTGTEVVSRILRVDTALDRAARARDVGKLASQSGPVGDRDL